MTLEKLLSEIGMSETYAPKIPAAYTEWYETDECTLGRVDTKTRIFLAAFAAFVAKIS